MNTCELNLGTSDVIAILAVLIAGLSALYARWTWREAKKSNAISLLAHRKEIYDAFFELKMHMAQNSHSAELAEVSKFYYHQRNARIYFPESLSKDIEKYFEACFGVASIYRREGGLSEEGMDKAEEHLAVELELSPKIDSSIIEILRNANA